ncbi:MAG: aminotransferase class I/II-fold pyridoxal phosphate-dependent enzyme [Gemmatimonadetes bacterium]|nr:aminotransferase class I/II-fold pyridoxal phosphate-dependent enzyme [Gemmatimonadota bacterium]NIQ52721.1 aminotransferase class I/II-fold pyridoxal phosphate-dependent enzyme [Gemmatimonadota bacterium]NIU72861.1 aminotransferase class I/II-fold pyridoxal phosphate-dependent enzyme [Gammaproteobacteria bacterium]NIX43225.1 aminotransferase class I/II-fold pyridoxal phosphate-dependent enzyme [Gemmatimonadota bacterium]NIY07396.1 aminotransferase class I/II-fold pyridoxal phosphate-depende
MRRRAFLQATLTATATAALTRPAEAVALTAGDLSPTRRAPTGPLRLNSNENALGPSEAARRAIVAGIGEANRYTHLVATELRQRVAEHHGVGAESVVFGNGSTEVLQMAVQAMAVRETVPAGVSAGGAQRADAVAAPAPGGPARLVVADPTFEHVEDYAGPWGLELVKVPLAADHSHDLDRMREAAGAAVRAGRPTLVYVCNPNNPTGSLTPTGEVESWIREAGDEVVFLVDEAYFEYVDHPTYRSALPLAGLRLGYAVAHPRTARRIAAFSANSNLNIMGLLAAGASLGDRDHVRRSLEANEAARRVTYAVLDELGLERIPSHTNFVMHRVPGDVRDYIRRMAERDVRVGRPFPPMLGHNRLSFGTPDEMERFAGVLREFRRAGWV